MKSASLSEIKKELDTLDHAVLQKLCISLARYKKENKELMTYLLFEASDERAYIKSVKSEVDELFELLPKSNLYLIKKSIRKILRMINKHIRYSGIAETELEVRIYFCLKMRSAHIPLNPGTVLYNLYHQQVHKIEIVLSKLPEDLQYDYDREMKSIMV